MARRSGGLPRLRDDLSRLRGALRAPRVSRDSLVGLGASNDPYWEAFVNRPPADIRNMIPEIIGKAPEVDALLFDTAGPDPDSGDLYDRFVAAGVGGKPIVNVELFGGWTGRFERGVFPEEVRRAYLREVEAAAARTGLSVFVEGRNLTGEEYVSAVVSDAGDGRYFEPGDGRGVFGGFEWEWK